MPPPSDRAARTALDGSDEPGALHAEALRCQRLGRLGEAEALWARVLAVAPEHAEARRGLEQLRRFAGQQAVALDHAARLLGIARGMAGERSSIDAAVVAARAHAELEPASAQAHRALGDALQRAGRHGEAAASYREAARLGTPDAELENNLGCVLQALGDTNGALEHYRAAIALDATLATAHNNMGTALKAEGKVEEALACYERAATLAPDFALARYNRACARLLTGRWAEGWPEYEWRWPLPDVRIEQRRFAEPAWDGAPLDGRTILLHAEAGLGDTLNFVRFVPAVQARGGRVVVECQPGLLALLRDTRGAAVVIARGEPLPPFEVQAPLMSLPALLGTTLENLPAAVPYIAAPSGARGLGHARRGALRVGLVWAANRGHPNGGNRSCPLAELVPLLGIPDTEWYSLQFGTGLDELRATAGAAPLRDLSDTHPDLADVAAVMNDLDLVISVDTLFAHLAGALGRPAWILLPHHAVGLDWRWLLDRADSPWYPTARLFRQPRPGAWDGVAAALERALRELVAARSGVAR